MTEFLEAVLRGLGTGSVYALLALGFVIIYKSTGVISFAQPALMLTGRHHHQLRRTGDRHRAVRRLLVLPRRSASAALPRPLIALLIERTAIRPMVGRPAFVVAIITIGIDIVVRVVASGFIGLGARPIPNPWGLERVERARAARPGAAPGVDGHPRGDRGGAVLVLPATPATAWRCARRPSTRRRR